MVILINNIVIESRQLTIIGITRDYIKIHIV